MVGTFVGRFPRVNPICWLPKTINEASALLRNAAVKWGMSQTDLTLEKAID